MGLAVAHFMCLPTVSAQAPTRVIVGAESERLAREQGMDAPESLRAWAQRTQPALAPADLDVLRQIEALSLEARRSAARLDEGDALRRLARARALAGRHLSIPGIAAWLAELELAVAVVAAQAELENLARASLRRAATIDPERVLQAAEARPELVEQSRAMVRTVATGPRGRFELSADVPGARAFLDDRPLGELPRTVEAAVGAHVLRIEAPGHRTYAQMVEVLEGERAPIRVSLAPTHALLWAGRADEAARLGRLDALAEALGALGPFGAPPVELLWFGSSARMVSVSCDASGCGAPRTLDGRVAVEVPTLAEALRWLRSSPPPQLVPEMPWWERWYVWAGAGALLVTAASVIAVVASQPGQEGPLIIDLDTSALPRRP